MRRSLPELLFQGRKPTSFPPGLRASPSFLPLWAPLPSLCMTTLPGGRLGPARLSGHPKEPESLSLAHQALP